MCMRGPCYWGTRNVERSRASIYRRKTKNVKTDAAVHRIVSFALMVLACCSFFRDLLIKLPLTSVCLKPCLDALQSCLLQPSWELLFGKVLLSKHPAPVQRLAAMPRSAHRAVFLRWWKLKMKAWTLSCPLAAESWLVFWLHWLVHPLRWPKEISLASLLAWTRR